MTIVTHRAKPAGVPDDRLLADALVALGASARFAMWDDASVDWAATPVTIVRSTWDYHFAPDRWLAWIDAAAGRTMLVNTAPILRWNTDKRYLRELAATGVACVPTVFVEPDGRASLTSIMQDHGWTDLVAKPAIGASASGTRRFAGPDALVQGEAHLAQLLAGGAALVQPYVQEVEVERERSCVFIGGVFTHAFTKAAFNTDASGGTALRPYAPDAAELALAEAALDLAPTTPAYARVDMVPTARGPLLMELELIEPDLGLRLAPDAAVRLAQACLRSPR